MDSCQSLVFRIVGDCFPSSGATNHDDNVISTTRSGPAAQRTDTDWTWELGLWDFCFRFASHCRQWHGIRLRSQQVSSTAVHTSAPRGSRPYHSGRIIYRAGSVGVNHSKVLRCAVFEIFQSVGRAVVVQHFSELSSRNSRTSFISPCRAATPRPSASHYLHQGETRWRWDEIDQGQ